MLQPPLPKFDRTRDFVTVYSLDLNGRTIPVGCLFPKDELSDRRLRQLYQQRRLRFANEGEEPKVAPPPAWRNANKRDTELMLLQSRLEDTDIPVADLRIEAMKIFPNRIKRNTKRAQLIRIVKGAINDAADG